MRTFEIYLTRSGSNNTFLLCNKEQQFVTTNENEANAFYDKQLTLLHSLPQSTDCKGTITLHMDFREIDSIGGYAEFSIRSASVPLSFHSMLALEQSL